jgi:hypothetical protein
MFFPPYTILKKFYIVISIVSFIDNCFYLCRAWGSNGTLLLNTKFAFFFVLLVGN